MYVSSIGLIWIQEKDETRAQLLLRWPRTSRVFAFERLSLFNDSFSVISQNIAIAEN